MNEHLLRLDWYIHDNRVLLFVCKHGKCSAKTETNRLAPLVGIKIIVADRKI